MRRAPEIHEIQSSRSQQSGFALAMTLIMLLILTILGVTAVSMSTLQQKMAANMQDTQVALQAADSALRDAEAWIIAQEPNRPARVGGTPACTTATTICDMGIGDTIAPQADSWWTTNAVQFGTTSSTPELVKPGSRDPHYVIEFWDFVPYDLGMTPDYLTTPGAVHFRITAQGWGNTPNAKALVQAKYVKQYLSGS